MPGAVADLADLGVDPAGHRIAGIAYLDGEHRVETDFRHGDGRGVRRTVLHSALADAVALAGVKVETRPVEEVDTRGDHVLVDGERFALPRRRRRPALADPAPPRARAAAPDGTAGSDCAATSRSRPGRRTSRCTGRRSSEAYVTPVADDLVGVAVLTDSSRPFPELLAEHPLLAERLAGADWQRVRGAGPLRQRSRRRTVGPGPARRRRGRAMSTR